MADIVYINSLSGKRGKYGIKISGKAEAVIDEIRKHTNNKGYINLELKERREEGKYGQTHYVVLDTYDRGQNEPPAPPPTIKAEQPAPQEPEDDLPF